MMLHILIHIIPRIIKEEHLISWEKKLEKLKKLNPKKGPEL